MIQRIRTIPNRLLLIATLSWAAIIIILAIAPRVSVMPATEHSQALNHGPLAHFGAFALLAAMLFELRVRTNTRFPLLQSIIFAGSYGALVECAQYLVPYRSFDPADIAMNFAAACFGALAMQQLTRKIN